MTQRWQLAAGAHTETQADLNVSDVRPEIFYIRKEGNTVGVCDRD